MRALSCGAESPLDCFRCTHEDCVCNDMSTAEEGKWMRGMRHKPDKREEPKRVTISISNDTTCRAVKSNVRRNNYEFLFY